MMSSSYTRDKKIDHISEKIERMTSSVDTLIQKMSTFKYQIEFLNGSMDMLSAQYELLGSKVDTQTYFVKRLDNLVKYTLSENFFCSICYEDNVDENRVFTPCNHTFHQSCLDKWCKIKNECPFCRKMLTSLND